MDPSKDDVLIRWFKCCCIVHGCEEEATKTKFHQDSQGLNRLDRTIGKELTTTKFLKHPLFGRQFKTYIEYCHHTGAGPRGRVLIAIMSFRFRLDRQRGNHITVVHLLGIQLKSFKHEDVREFLEMVSRAKLKLLPDQHLDNKLMFEWLFEKFKQWHPIKSTVEKILNSRVDSAKGQRYRSFDFLWSVIEHQLTIAHENANQASLQAGLLGGVVGGAPALSLIHI